MAKIKLTALSLDALKKRDKPYEVGDSEAGLRVVVSTSGAKSFIVRYKLDGRAGKLTIGRTDRFTLAEAREAAREAMKLVARGVNPARHKQDEKAARIAAEAARKSETANLVENAVEEFIRLHAKAKKSGHEIERLMRREVIPVWKGKTVGEVTKADVQALTRAIKQRGAATTAKRTFANVRKFFNWLIEEGYPIEHSPCANVKMPAPEVKRERVLTDAELRLVLLGADQLSTPWREFVRMLAYTGARREEVAAAPWSEFSGLDGQDALWELPGARTKNGRPHLLPLPSAVASMLASMPRIGDKGLAFTVTGETPLVAFSVAKKKLDAAMLARARKEAQEAGQDPDEIAVAPWRFHDLRRTAASGMARLRVPPHEVEAVLNHVSGVIAGVAGIYNRYQYFDEKKAALATWAAHLARLESGGAAPSNVIPLRA